MTEEEARGLLGLSFESKEPAFEPGDQVGYWSERHQAYMSAVVLKARGAVADLQLKQVRQIRHKVPPDKVRLLPMRGEPVEVRVFDTPDYMLNPSEEEEVKKEEP